jgi:hypothetical protein
MCTDGSDVVGPHTRCWRLGGDGSNAVARSVLKNTGPSTDQDARCNTSSGAGAEERGTRGCHDVMRTLRPEFGCDGSPNAVATP